MYDSPSMHDVKQLETVMRYHEETKHHFNRYARALGYMDWANQPNPFRRYEGATLGRLPILSPDEEPLSPPYADLYRSGAVSSAPVTIRTLSRLFEYALALSAWKQAGGTRWALRSNPSSGNLHPTEGYLLIGAVPGVAFTPGLYHYAPREHGLERRADCPTNCSRSCCTRFRRRPSWWDSRPFTGGRRGSTASARSATASMTRATRSPRSGSRLQRLAGPQWSCTVWPTRLSKTCWG